MIEGYESPWRRVDPSQNEFARLDEAQREAWLLRRLNILVAHARAKAEYYKDLPAEPLTSTDQIRGLPILENPMYRKHTPPNGTQLVAIPNSSGLALASGGTTGEPRSCYRTAEEQHVIATRLAWGLDAAGIKPGDVVANLMPPGNLWVPFISYLGALEHLEVRVLPIGRAYSAEAALKWMNRYQVNVLLGYPAEIVRVVLEAPQGSTFPKIRLIATSGTPVYEGPRRLMEQAFGGPRFVSAGYASNDTGPMGYQCEHCNTGTFHLQDDLQILEILDVDSHEPIAKGVNGKMIFTQLLLRVVPVIRYAIGDIGKWVNEDHCPCGRRSPRFELSGRTDDMLVGEALQLLPETLDKALHGVAGIGPDWQLQVTSENSLDCVTLRVETLPDIAPHTVDVDLLRCNLLTCCPDMVSDLEEQRLGKVEAKVYPYGALPRSPRTGKITLFLDERRR
ncbi:hypothetical protein IV102_05520 [bacterium]|nr:hypothetical protein [bacterium]